MPESVLTQKRSLIAWFAVLAMIASLIAIAQPASAHTVARDTTATCPTTIPNAGFTDISAFDAETQHAINCIAFYGVTIGTSATTYSPSQVTIRRHMALFLIRSASDMGITIPAASNQGFTDISTLPQAEQDAINQLAQLGITKGTGPGTFSPNEDVDRWEMALFLQRLLNVAGFTFTDDATHGNFADTLTLSAEAQAAIDDLADAHVALGVGGGLYAPFDAVSRWQMALFLTRTLAADGVVAAGTQVTITPSASATQSPGTARQYTAAFRNADGTNYTGAVILRLRDATATGGLGTAAATGVEFESVDGAAASGQVWTAAFAGPDGSVVFVARHTTPGTAADAIPQGIIDSDGDDVFDSGEQSGVGGAVFFGATPVTEATAGSHTVTVVSTNKAGDSFVGDPGALNCGNGATIDCRFDYDDNDIYTGAATSMAEFETKLSAGDTVTANPYATAASGQSTFNLVDTVADLTVNAPTTPVDAATATLSGTANPGWEVVVYRDQNANNTYETGTDVAVTAAATATADGSWSASAPLNQSADNHFVVVQRTPGSGVNTAPANVGRDTEDVPTIVEAPGTGFTLTNLSASGDTNDLVGAGDTITLDFSEGVANLVSGDSLTFRDDDGTVGRVIVGTNATATRVDADTYTLALTAVTIDQAGGTAGLAYPATLTAQTGIADSTDGTALSVTSGDNVLNE